MLCLWKPSYWFHHYFGVLYPVMMRSYRIIWVLYVCKSHIWKSIVNSFRSHNIITIENPAATPTVSCCFYTCRYIRILENDFANCRCDCNSLYNIAMCSGFAQSQHEWTAASSSHARQLWSIRRQLLWVTHCSAVVQWYFGCVCG